MAAWTDATRDIDGRLEVQWDGATWTDESANLLAASGSMEWKPLWQMQGGIGVQQPWRASFRLRNAADRYSPTNSGGALYSYIGSNKGHGIAIRFSMGLWNGSSYDYTRVFTGYIDRLNISSTRDDRCSLACLDNAMPLLQNKATTTMYLDQRTDEWLTVLANAGNVASTAFDAGLLIIPFCWLDDENLWTEMHRTAHSEAGYLYFDRNGTLTFENVESWGTLTRHTSSQHTFDTTRPRDITPVFHYADIYNEVIVEYAPRAQRGRIELYRLDEAVRLLPGQSRTIICRLRYPATAIFTPVANKDYHIITAAGKDLTGNVNLTLTKYAQRMEAIFTNNHSYHLAVVNDFRLTGVPLIGYPAMQHKLQAIDSDIGDPTGTDETKTFRVQGNDYVQRPEQADLMASLLRDQTKHARQTYRIVDVQGVPTLTPGDRVTVIETDSGLNNEGFILNINWRYGDGSYRFDTVEILDADSWYLYSDYFDLTTSLIGSSDRIFY